MTRLKAAVPRAKQSTLTDGCWDDMKHPAPNPRSRFLAYFAHRLLHFSSACLILYCFSPIFFLFNVASFMPLWISTPFSFYHPVSTVLQIYHNYHSTLSSFLLQLALSHCILPHLLTHQAPSSGQWFDKKVEDDARRECARPHCIQDCIACATDLLLRGTAVNSQSDYHLLLLLFLPPVWNSPRRPIDKPHRRQHVTHSETSQGAKMQA